MGMDNKYRIHCPKNTECTNVCKDCDKTKNELGHTINKNYLKSIGRQCLCAECCDQ